MIKKKTRVSDADKVKILKRHLLEKVTVSELCDENSIAPSVFYKWQSKLFDNAEEALRSSRKQPTITKEQERIQLLERRLQQREEALAELMTERLALKKSSIGLA
jgi:transposase-like protein